MGIAGGARGEDGQVRRRSGMDFGARQNRGKRPDRRLDHQPVPDTDLVLVGEITQPERRPAMIYELRIYHTMPGKLPALLKRFDTITLKIWERHGIKQAGFWTTLVGESNADLTYMLQWESLAEREKKWDAFQADPEW